MNTEANALVDEYNRIVSSTQFNGVSLLDPKTGSINIAAGIGSSNVITLNLTQNLQRTIGDGTFGTPVTINTSGYNGAVTVGDVNGDGKAVVIASGFFSGTAASQILIGNGDGTFKAPVTLTVYATAGQFIDVNGDGKTDLVYIDNTNTKVGVLLGNGDGTFNAPISQTSTLTGGTLRAISVADFNNDGKLDFITGGSGDTTLQVYTGNGDGTFNLGTSFSVTGQRQFIPVGDINNDGKMDIFIRNGNSGNVNYFALGNGDGTFLAPVTIKTSGSFAQEGAMADVNGDGNLDIIMTDTSGSGSLDVALGNGDGTFKANIYNNVAGFLSQATVTDINKDGIPDLVVNSLGLGTIQVLVGNGDGTFYLGSKLTTAVGLRGATVGDVNGDGVPDYIYNNSSTNSTYELISKTTTTTTEAKLNLLTKDSARASLDTLSTTLSSISLALGSLGASQSRLEVAASNLQALRENYSAAASRITDSDTADEAAKLIRATILQKAATAMLAQDNLSARVVLSLIG